MLSGTDMDLKGCPVALVDDDPGKLGHRIHDVKVMGACADGLWERSLCAMAEQAGLRTFAEVATRTCQLFLGLRADGLQWCRRADDALCAGFMEDILANGNFGIKRTRVLDLNQGLNHYDIRHPLRFAAEAHRVGREKLARAGHGRLAPALGWAYQSQYLVRRYAALRLSPATAGASDLSRKRNALHKALGL